jgi:hypothetical protein
MRGLRLKILPLFALLVVACAASRAQQRDAWVALGQRDVSDRVDHDVISVTAKRGEFQRIKLLVQRAPVDFHRVVVHYGDGSKQEVEMRNTIRAGSETRAIDLEGRDRVIRNVEFWYDARTIRGRKASVRVLGMR